MRTYKYAMEFRVPAVDNHKRGNEEKGGMFLNINVGGQCVKLPHPELY